MNRQLAVQSETKSASSSGALLQRKCACGQHARGGECEECRKKKQILQRHVGISVQPAGAPSTVHERFGHDFSQAHVHTAWREIQAQTSFRSRYLQGRLEEAGEAACDPDAGKIVFKINYAKFPLCMADCVFAHEKAHADFGQAECAKVAAAAKAASDAVKKAKESKSPDDLAKAEQAVKDFEKAKEAYDKWMDQNCVADEAQAYQAGIDKCKGVDVKKGCADEGETKRYEKIMTDWENFKKAPPNCKSPSPPPKPSGTPAPPPSGSPKGTSEMEVPQTPVEKPSQEDVALP